MLIISSTLLFSGCTFKIFDKLKQNNTINKEISSSQQTSYPVIATSTEYPYPVIVEDKVGERLGPEFHIDLPVSGGDLTVTGTGPAGVPIVLVDVSEVGLTLGKTTIKENGTFIFNLKDPLQSSHLIGLQLGDIEGTIWEESDFLYSETYYERPLIGILFDLVVVE